MKMIPSWLRPTHQCDHDGCKDIESRVEREYQEQKLNAEQVMERSEFWLRRIQRQGPSWESLLIPEQGEQ